MGETEITGLLEAEDVINTADAMRGSATVVRKGVARGGCRGAVSVAGPSRRTC